MRHTKYALHILISILLILLAIYAAFASKAIERIVPESITTIDPEASDSTGSTTKQQNQPADETHPFVVVHLGDSHVQAGYFSQPLRRFFVTRYGAAGYGWLSPHRLSGTNQNEAYRLSASPARWRTIRITSNSGYEQVGPGGLLLYPEASSVSCSVEMRDGSKFRRLLIYRTAAAPPLLPEGPYRYELARADSTTKAGIVVDTLRFASSLTAVSLFAQGCKANDGYAGFEAIDDGIGCLFNEIGNNGATYTQYATEEYTRNMALLRPDILIISLGTNESMGRSFSASAFATQVDTLFRLIRKYLPHTRIVITTPPPNYRASRVKTGTKRERVNKKGKKTRYRTTPIYKTIYSLNQNVSVVAKVLRDYASKQGYDCVDLYDQMCAGDGGQRWISQGLYARDRVHFSIAGYKKQGEMVAQALESLL